MNERNYTDSDEALDAQQLAIPPPLPQEEGKKLNVKGILGYIALGFVIIFKYLAKLKFLVIPVVKFFPMLLKTGGTMILSIGAYAMLYGWWFAVGFVLLLFIHESGHLLAAKRIGLKVGAPVFIPFMGAFIALKDAPKDAWIEAQVGLGGPLIGSLGAFACHVVFLLTGIPIFLGLAFTGYFLNLFNLAPLTPLDGGRICAAMSPWLWLVGLVIVLAMMIMRPNVILLLLIVFSAPQVWSLFKKKSAEQARYYEVAPWQRGFMAIAYFGLAGLLWYGMHEALLVMPHQ